MISPELLRRYLFFSDLNAAQVKAVALLADVAEPRAATALFEPEQPADALYLLMEGHVELWYVVADKHEQNLREEYYICDINPGEILGISALIPPHQYVSAARATGPARLIRFEAKALRRLCAEDCELGYVLMRQAARSAMERLHDTRIQLISARV